MIPEDMTKRILRFLLLFFITISGFANTIPITVESSLDTTIATIGDRIHLVISLQYPPESRFELPKVERRLGEWEVIDQQLSSPRKIKGGFQQTWELELTVFDTGKVIVPELEIRAFSSEDTSRVLRFKTDEQIVDVISVLPPGTTEPKDIKPPFPIRTIIPWNYIIFILLILIIIVSGIITYRRWKQKQSPLPLDEDYLEAPHLVAFRKLNELRERQSRSEDEIRFFYFRMSEIVREYLERRYFIKALEMTTREILEAFHALDISEIIALEYSQLFGSLDLVKFAKQIPEANEMVFLWELAYKCIDKTKREPFLNRRSS